MSIIAFYTPMKPPDDPVPSGDRTMARALLAALEGAGLGDVYLASKLRSRDGAGDPATQDRIFEDAEAEIERLSAGPRPDLWFTYHSYYKAPDLLGPRLSRAWGIPYALVEGNTRLEAPAGPLCPLRQSSRSGMRCCRRHLLSHRIRPRGARTRSRGRPAARQAQALPRRRSVASDGSRDRSPTLFGYSPVQCSARAINWRATRPWRLRWVLCGRRPGR